MKQHIKYYLSNNIMEYIKAFFIFIIGVIISIIVINNSSNNQKEEIKTYIDEKIETVKNTDEIDSLEILKKSIYSNIKELTILTFLSTTLIGIPVAYYVIIRKGFSIGYTIAAICATLDTKRAIIFICNSMILHNIIYIVSMLIVLVSGINFARSIVGKKENLKFAIMRFSIFILIAFFVSIISSLSESYVSTNLVHLFKKYL